MLRLLGLGDDLQPRAEVATQALDLVAEQAGCIVSEAAGSVLKVEAFGLTAKGKLREARLDADTPTSWLVKY